VHPHLDRRSHQIHTQMCVASPWMCPSLISHASTDENYETQQGGLIKALPRSHQVPSFNCRSSALSRTSRTSIVAPLYQYRTCATSRHLSPSPRQRACNNQRADDNGAGLLPRTVAAQPVKDAFCRLSQFTTFSHSLHTLILDIYRAMID